MCPWDEANNSLELDWSSVRQMVETVQDFFLFFCGIHNGISSTRKDEEEHVWSSVHIWIAKGGRNYGHALNADISSASDNTHR